MHARVAACIVLLAALAPATRTVQAQTTITLEGTVTDAADARPIGGAQLVVTSLGSGERRRATTRASAIAPPSTRSSSSSGSARASRSRSSRAPPSWRR
ncbi:MAG: hypothetical protein MUF21_14740 [Gemmatimonadaceae bacterium]|nr:hypothetical protein [Gemmatimonadaceae bacterium]